MDCFAWCCETLNREKQRSLIYVGDYSNSRVRHVTCWMKLRTMVWQGSTALELKNTFLQILFCFRLGVGAPGSRYPWKPHRASDTLTWRYRE